MPLSLPIQGAPVDRLTDMIRREPLALKLTLVGTPAVPPFASCMMQFTLERPAEENGFTIPLDTRVRTQDGNFEFATQSDLIIRHRETRGVVFARCTRSDGGTGYALGQVNQLPYPIERVSAATNLTTTAATQASASCTLEFKLAKAEKRDVVIFPGALVRTKDGRFDFVTSSLLVIPPGATEGNVLAVCTQIGGAANGYAEGQVSDLIEIPGGENVFDLSAAARLSPQIRMAVRPASAGSFAALARGIPAENLRTGGQNVADVHRRGELSVTNITMTTGGGVDVIVDNYLGGGSQVVSEPYGPAWFRPEVNPRLAVCNLVSAYAAARCFRGRGYF